MSNADDALAAAEAAEAEAVEAEAAAAAARARARAIRLRQEAEAKAAETKAAEVESSAVELDEPTADAEPAPVDEPAVTTVTADAPKKRRGLRPTGGFWKIAAATVAILAAVGLLALSGAMYLSHMRVEAQQERSAEFAAAARQGVVTLMSLDHTRAQEDVDAIVAVTTGDFKKDFESQAADMVKVAQENKVVTQVTVNSVAVQKMTEDTATVLLAAMSTVSNAASEKQEPRAWRLSVDVARDGDQIKLAKVEFVP